MYKALLVARYIIKKCNQIGRSISNLKLQKLLYFVQAEFLVDIQKPCFEEAIEAWNFGPVVPEVYREYKGYGSANIPYMSKDEIPQIESEHKELIDCVIEELAQYSASALVSITHNQSPWIDAYTPNASNIISNNSIRKYFSEE